MLIWGDRNQHFSLNEALTLSQGQQCRFGLKPAWTLIWKMYLGRYSAKAEGCFDLVLASHFRVSNSCCVTQEILIFSVYTRMDHSDALTLLVTF